MNFTVMGGTKSKTLLSKEDMEFLQTSTRYDRRTILEWHKGFARDCPDGKMNPAKLLDISSIFYSGQKAADFIDEIFDKYDQDNLGFINFKEFLLAIDTTPNIPLGSPEEMVKWGFRLFDNGYGILEETEFHKMLQYILQTLEANFEIVNERATAIFKKIDADHEGCVTEEECIKGILTDNVLLQILIQSNPIPDSRRSYP